MSNLMSEIIESFEDIQIFEKAGPSLVRTSEAERSEVDPTSEAHLEAANSEEAQDGSEATT